MAKEYSNILKMRQIPQGLIQFGEKLTFRKNDIIIYPGESLEGIYFIQKGRAAYVSYSPIGHEKIFFIVEPGCIAGEVALNEKPLNVFLKALENSEVLLIRKTHLDKKLTKDYSLTLFLIDSLCKKLISLSQQMEEWTFYDAESRVCNLFIQLAETYGIRKNQKIKLDLNINQQFISNIIGINRVTAVRIIKKLKCLKLIEMSHGQYIIKDLSSLKAYVKNSVNDM